MKKLLALVLSTSMLFSVASSLSVFAADEVSNPDLTIDTTPPTVEITVGETVFTSAVTPVTFDTLIKDKVQITITASDLGSAIKSIEYQEVASEADYTLDGVWKPYTEKFDVNSTGKKIIYAKATDFAGNQTIINTNGFIIYTPSTLKTELAEFDKSEENQRDILVTVNLKGNTLKEITNGETVLKSGTDYIINDTPAAKNSVVSPESDLKLVIQKSYLATLAVGTQTLTFNFNPYGICGGLVTSTPLEIAIKDTGHIHEYDTDFTIDRNSTCTQKGEKSRHCKGFAFCGGKTDITEIGLAPHTGGGANCNARAVCSLCHNEYGEKDPNNHSGETELRNVRAATHYAEGYSGDTYCKGCNALLKSGEGVRRVRHTLYAEWKHNENIHWYNCTGCDEKFNVANHSWVNGASYLARGGEDYGFNGNLQNAMDRNGDAYSMAVYYYVCPTCGEVIKGEPSPPEEVLVMTIGDNSVYTPGTTQGATFVSPANIKDFLWVSMDGIPLKLSDIKVKAGSTIVTISSEYMDTLSAGKHTVSICSTTGTATANFTVAEKAAETPESQASPKNSASPEKPENPATPENPNTHGNGNMLLWVSLLFVLGG
ncbi:MAG: X2-like carbohydrate binding domain-containing protein, partial [Oscillospiraceae bacterium]